MHRKKCCKSYRILPAIINCTVKIQQTLACCKIVVTVCKHLVNLFHLSPLRRNIISYSTHVCVKMLNKEMISVSASLQSLSLNKAAEHQCLYHH